MKWEDTSEQSFCLTDENEMCQGGYEHVRGKIISGRQFQCVTRDEDEDVRFPCCFKTKILSLCPAANRTGTDEH